jgi:hypothetical protein
MFCSRNFSAICKRKVICTEMEIKTQKLEAAGIDPKWAAEISRQIKNGRGFAPALCDAGVPTTLAVMLAREIDETQVPVFAMNAQGRTARFEFLGLPNPMAQALANTISEAQK